MTEAEETTPTPTATLAPALCGNGRIEAGEACDDGGICIGEGGTACPSGSCPEGQDCTEGFCVRRCNDGNDCAAAVCRPVGGDGCARNCTREELRSARLTEGDSSIRIQARSFLLRLRAEGSVTLRTGQPRAERVFDPQQEVLTEPGDLPVAIKATDWTVPPLPIANLACICIRPVPLAALFGPNVSAQGTIGCGEQGLTDVSYRTVRDHNTGPGDPRNGSGIVGIPQLPDDPECDNEISIDGEISRACREIIDEECSDPATYLHQGVCISPTVVELRGGAAPRGSALIHTRVAISLLSDFGTCGSENPMPDGQCRFGAYGPDCLPCTDDDRPAAVERSLLLTTGTAQAAIYDAGNQPLSFLDEGSGAPCSSDDDCRPHESCQRTCDTSGFLCNADDDCTTNLATDFCRSARCEVLCTGTRCLTTSSGDPFDCELLLDDPQGALRDGALAFANPGVDTRNLGDNVTTGVLRFE